MENNQLNEGLENSSPKSLYDKITGSMLLKIFVIFFLTIILLIPMALIGDLISERKQRETQVSTEIARKWGLEQVVSTPVIAVPYDAVHETIKPTTDGKQTTERIVVKEWAFLLPENSAITAEVQPEPLKRGIFQAIVYNAKVTVKGNFKPFDLTKLDVPATDLKWNEAKMVFGIQDTKGLSANPNVQWNGQGFPMDKYFQELDLFTNNLTTNLNLTGNEDLNKPFQITMDLKGSKSLNFLPLAKQTTIHASGNWANPSFNGNFLPEDREVNETFRANWSIPDFNRKLAQQWTGEPVALYNFLGVDLASEDVQMTDFPEPKVVGAAESSDKLTSNDYDMVQINFLPNVNNYQKATRVTKYGALVIALTFISLIFMEIIKKQRVHLIQYVLIGFAMVLFYALLLAISEHIGFNLAYLLAAVATILLIATFVRAITKDGKSAWIFGAILALFYTFIFVLLQLRDYSLIVGTVGLFIILAVLMRLSTKINWYQFEK